MCIRDSTHTHTPGTGVSEADVVFDLQVVGAHGGGIGTAVRVSHKVSFTDGHHDLQARPRLQTDKHTTTVTAKHTTTVTAKQTRHQSHSKTNTPPQSQQIKHITTVTAKQTHHHCHSKINTPPQSQQNKPHWRVIIPVIGYNTTHHHNHSKSKRTGEQSFLLLDTT